MNDLISITCTKSHFQTLVFFFSFSEFSCTGNQNHYFLSIEAPFSIQIIIHAIVQGKVLSSPNICPASSPKGWGSWHFIFMIPCSTQHFFHSLHWMFCSVKLGLRGFDLLSTRPGGWGCQGTLRLKDRRGPSKNVLWSSGVHPGHGSGNSQPQNRQ